MVGNRVREQRIGLLNSDELFMHRAAGFGDLHQVAPPVGSVHAASDKSFALEPLFLMTRVREEAMQHGTSGGVRRGLAVTGGVITSAGIVLAATFGALAVIPILFLAQIAFIVAFGVLLETLIVRSLLVPATRSADVSILERSTKETP